MIAIVLHLLYSFIFGASILVFILEDERRFSRLEYVILSYLLGFGIIAYLLFVFSLLGLGNDALLVLVSVVVLFIFFLSLYMFRFRWESLYRYFIGVWFVFYGYRRGIVYFFFLFMVFLLCGLFFDFLVSFFVMVKSGLVYFASLFFSGRDWGVILSLFSGDIQLILLGVILSFFCIYLFYFFRKRVLSSGGYNLSFILAAIILLQIAVIFIVAFGLGVSTSDAIDMWSFRAKIIYYKGFDSLLADSVRHPTYPLFSSFGQYWLYLLSGGFTEHINKAIFPIFYACFLGFTYVQLSKLGSQLSLARFSIMALFIVMLLGFVKVVVVWAFTAYSDLGLAVLYFVSVIYLFEFFRGSERFFLILSSIFLGFCTFMKNEGIAFYAVTVFIFFIFVLRMKDISFKERMLYFIVYSFIPLLFFVPWKLIAIISGITTDVFVGSILDRFTGNVFARLPEIIWTFVKYLTSIGVGFIGVIAFISYFVSVRILVRSKIKPVVLAVVLNFLIYIFIFIISPFSVERHMSTPAYRLILQQYLLILFSAVYLFLVFWQESLFVGRIKSGFEKLFERLLLKYSFSKEKLLSKVGGYVGSVLLVVLFIYLFVVSGFMYRYGEVFLTDDIWTKRSVTVRSFLSRQGRSELEVDMGFFRLLDGFPAGIVLGVSSMVDYNVRGIVGYWYYPRRVEKLDLSGGNLSSGLILTRGTRDYLSGYRLIYENDLGDMLFMREGLYNRGVGEEGTELSNWLNLIVEASR